jgi:tetratricopeptide (TPR) repeat protein
MSNMNLAAVLAQEGKLAESIEIIPEAIRIFEKLVSENPMLSEIRVSAGQAHFNHALMLSGMRESERAVTAARQAADVFEKLCDETGSVHQHAVLLESVYSFLIRAESERNQSEQVRSLLEKQFAILSRISQAEPGNQRIALKRVESAQALANEYDKAGRGSDSVKWLRESLEALEASAKALESNTEAPKQTTEIARAYSEIGRVRWLMGDLTAAAEAYENAQVHLHRVSENDPANDTAALLLAITQTNQGLLLVDQGQQAEAIKMFDRAIDWQQASLERGNERVKQNLRSALWGKGDALRRLGRYVDAIDEFDRALKLNDVNDGPGLSVEKYAVQVRVGDRSGAVNAVESLEATAGRNGQLLYNLARVAASAADVIRSDDSVAADERDQAVERYTARSLSLLTDAVETGYFASPRAIQRLISEPDFDVLRSRDDFKRLFETIQNVPD